MGGNIPEEGRVEFCYNNVWGTVCDHSWDDDDATVVCRQLGLSSAEAVSFGNARFGGESTGPIWLDDVRCVGTESRLIYCPADAIGDHKFCEHDEDAGVRCMPGMLHTSSCFQSDFFTIALAFVESMFYGGMQFQVVGNMAGLSSKLELIALVTSQLESSPHYLHNSILNGNLGSKVIATEMTFDSESNVCMYLSLYDLGVAPAGSANCLFLLQVVVMVIFVLWVELLLWKVVWSSAMTTPGALCVMTPGMMTMLALFAGSWDSQPQERQLSVMPSLARALVISCWMRLAVSELRADWLTVLLMLLVTTTVDTMKMLESGA